MDRASGQFPGQGGGDSQLKGANDDSWFDLDLLGAVNGQGRWETEEARV